MWPTPRTIVDQALEKMHEPYASTARQVVYLTAAGWGTIEIGKRLGITWKAVNESKRQLGDALVSVLVEDEGYSRDEAVRLLRVPGAVVDQAVAAANGSERNSEVDGTVR